VAVEFVIVVVGVFMGLQVQEWSINQAARSEEISALFALGEDLKADIAVIDGTLTRYRDEQDAREQLARFASNPDATLSPERLADLMYLGIWRWSPYDPTQPTLDELKTSGKLSQFGSRELRRKVQEYFIKLAQHRRNQENLVHIVFSFADSFIAREYEMSSFLSASSAQNLQDIATWFELVSADDDVSSLKSRVFRTILAQLAVANSDVTIGTEALLAVHRELIVLVDQRLDDVGAQRLKYPQRKTSRYDPAP
jgi:hypothetical protein